MVYKINDQSDLVIRQYRSKILDQWVVALGKKSMDREKFQDSGAFLQHYTRILNAFIILMKKRKYIC